MSDAVKACFFGGAKRIFASPKYPRTDYYSIKNKLLLYGCSSHEPLLIQPFGKRLAHQKNTPYKACFFGGAKRIRTAGLLVANEALYQLSHNPENIIYYIRLPLFCQRFFIPF